LLNWRFSDCQNCDIQVLRAQNQDQYKSQAPDERLESANLLKFHHFNEFDVNIICGLQPSSKERCNPPSCMGANHDKHQGLPVWATVLISLTSLAAVAGLALVGFMFYRYEF